MQNFDTCNKKKQIPLVIPKKIQKKNKYLFVREQ